MIHRTPVEVINALGYTTADVRELIASADRQDVPMKGRVIHLPAKVDSHIYGCKIQLDANLGHIELRAPRVDHHRVRL